MMNCQECGTNECLAFTDPKTGKPVCYDCACPANCWTQKELDEGMKQYWELVEEMENK